MSARKVLIEKELGATPTEIESQVVDILVINKFAKKHILFLRPNREKGSRTPDIHVDDDLRWEIKSVEKNGKYTLDHAERAGLKQSENLIFDLRKLKKYDEEKITRTLKKDFRITKKWRRLIIITREEGVLTCEK
ncbi:MAG: hypothetical protein LBC95_01230 [Candidatus Nomurabacteria bacterium]|jgi:hypothetical protein|nr:hypothetical protein [Candidatus Nomurabacteria bacterium]